MTRLFAGTAFDIPPSCDECGKLESECTCTPEQKRNAEREREQRRDRLPPEKQTAKVRTEVRKGERTVTVIDGLTTRANDLPALLSELKTACGTGGTIKPNDSKNDPQDRIELQGDHVTAVAQQLRNKGYRVNP